MRTTPSTTGSAPFATFFMLVIGLVLLAMVTIGNIASGTVVLRDVYDVAASGAADVIVDSPCATCGVVEQIRLIPARRVGAGLGAIVDRPSNTWDRGPSDTADGQYLGGRFRVTVLLRNGTRRVATETDPPAYAVGDQVRMADTGAIVPRRIPRI